jgi:prevent-host-death family protein
MKSISVTEFKAHCFELIDEVARMGESLVLTKRGKPIAIVGPPPVQGREKWIPGQFKDSAKIVGDILAPLDEPWEGPHR